MINKMYEIIMSFHIYEMSREKLNVWLELHNHSGENKGAIGGAFTYSFTNTNIGQVSTVKCFCGDELDLSDYDSW